MKKLIVTLLVIAITSIIALLIFSFNSNEKPLIAAAYMLLGAFFLWVMVIGSAQYVFRDTICSFIKKIRIGWKTKFVLFATFLALLEEIIAVTMTNLAPLFGVKIGEAYFTVSPNFFDLVLFHSVVIFIPMFVVWAWFLSRYDFKANTVFLLFGVSGVITELVYGGVFNIILFAFWIFIYGLMVYLPAYCLPVRENLLKATFVNYFAAIFLPYILAIPFAFTISLFGHPSTHFIPL